MYEFKAYGHKNITSKHKTTLEFTKDEDLTLKGDCIVGVNADFSLEKIKEFIKSLKTKRIKIIIELKSTKKSTKQISSVQEIQRISEHKKIKEEIIAEINPDFNSEREIVIRKSDFKDERTFAIRADKSAFDFNNSFKAYLKIDDYNIYVSLI